MKEPVNILHTQYQTNENCTQNQESILPLLGKHSDFYEHNYTIEEIKVALYSVVVTQQRKFVIVSPLSPALSHLQYHCKQLLWHDYKIHVCVYIYSSYFITCTYCCVSKCNELQQKDHFCHHIPHQSVTCVKDMNKGHETSLSLEINPN